MQNGTELEQDVTAAIALHAKAKLDDVLIECGMTRPVMHSGIGHIESPAQLLRETYLILLQQSIEIIEKELFRADAEYTC